MFWELHFLKCYFVTVVGNYEYKLQKRKKVKKTRARCLKSGWCSVPPFFFIFMSSVEDCGQWPRRPNHCF